MTQGAAPIDPETLLANTGWVRGLARQLLGDAARADDVVQATLLAALEHPPQAGVPLRPWLARVARNLSFQTMRSERRRRAHEAVAAKAFAATRTAAVAPDDSAARTDEFLAVVGEVRALEPIYRDVVILRFLDELEMDEVAARLGVPVETARTRLKRALAMLRERLDRRHGGDGKAWALALVPVAGGRDGWITGLATGGLVMAATTKTVLVSAVVGALLGALLTAGAMTAAETGPGDAGSAAESAAAARGDASARGSGGTPEPGAASAPRTDAGTRRAGAARVSEGSESLVSWLESVPVELPPPGTGTITGHVRTKDGNPVAGAVVRARVQQKPVPYRRGGAAPAHASIESEVRGAAASSKWHAATRREAVTDASGAYTLTELPALECRVSAYFEGHDLRLQPGSSGTATPDGVVDFTASPLVTVPLTVLGTDGKPADRAMVRWFLPPNPGGGGGGGGSSSWWISADPVVQPEPGTWIFVAETSQDVRSKPVTATVGAADAPADPIVLQLEGRNIIRGVVKFDAADRDWSYATVTARRRGAQDDEEDLRSGAHAPDFKYQFNDVKPGEYDVSVTLDDTTAVATAAVRVDGAPVEQALSVPKLTPAQVLEVRITRPDGSLPAMEDLNLSIYRRTGSMTFGMGTRPVRRADGVFLIPLGDPARAARGPSRAGGGGSGGAGGAGVVDTTQAGPASWFVQIAHKAPGEKGFTRPAKEHEFFPGTTTRLEVQLE